MKKLDRAALGAAAAACAGLFASAPASAQSAYVRGEVFGGFADQYKDVPNGDLDNSIGYGAAVGANVAPHIRLEGEFFHTGADFKTGGGDSSANIGMANAYYDFGDSTQLTPFVGAGVGYGRYEPTGGDDSAFTYQAIAGVSKSLTPRLTGEVSYKFVEAPDLTLAGTDTGFRSNYLGAGLRVKLGS